MDNRKVGRFLRHCVDKCTTEHSFQHFCRVDQVRNFIEIGLTVQELLYHGQCQLLVDYQCAPSIDVCF